LIPQWFNAVRSRIEALIPADSLRRRFAQGAFWSIVGACIAHGLNLVSGVVRGRWLGRDLFGQFGMVVNTIGMLGMFAGMGLGLTVTKYVAEYRLKDPARAGRIVSLVLWVTFFTAGLVSILSAVFMPCLADETLKNLLFELRLGCLLLFANTLLGVQNGVLAGLEAFRAVARINCFQAFFTFFCSLGGMFFWGLRGAVGGMAVGSVLTWGVNQRFVRGEMENRGIRTTWTGALGELPHVWRFALSAFFSSMLFGPVVWVHNMMMFTQPDGDAQMGYFTATRQWHSAILLLPGMISQTTLPMLTNLWSQREYEKYRKLFWANTALFAGLALVAAVPIALLSRFLMGLYDSRHPLPGTDFASGWPVLVVTCLYSVLWAMNMSPGQAIWSLGMKRAANCFALLRSAILLGIYYLLIERGAMGLVWAYTIAYVLQTLYMIPFVLLTVRRKMNQAVKEEQGEDVALVDPDGEV
jgi:O-antigen/teichoic acid export membrane protein